MSETVGGGNFQKPLKNQPSDGIIKVYVIIRIWKTFFYISRGNFMILYFSATGNTRFIATELAKKLDDECIDLLSRIKKGDFS